MKKNLNILLIDDHPILVEGLKNIIKNSVIDVDEIFIANNAVEGLNILNENKIDIVISDISMPEMNGVELAGIIKKKNSEIKIIIFSQFDDVQVIKPLMKLNIEGIILKGQETNDIITAIKAVQNRQKYFSKEIKDLIFNSLMLTESTPSLIKLSKRETEVLNLLADQKTSKEISEKLFVSVPTVETYRSNLFKKFEVRNIAGLIRKAMQLGFIE